jgi:hypothetical protein
MEKAEVIDSKLGNLKNELGAISKKEVVEINTLLCNLRSSVTEIENVELEQNEMMLRSLANEILSYEKQHFSFMKTLGIETLEVAHSNLLAWLFDPAESHGLGSKFLGNFIRKIAAKTNDYSLLNIDLSSVLVDTEISGDESRLDIRCWDPNGSFQCVIENKILSEEGADQTRRLYDNFHGKAARDLFVFLTLDRNAKPQNENFIHMAYGEILPELRDLLQNLSDNCTRFLIESYLNTLEWLVVSENFEGFSERTKLYYKYQKYINDVNKAFNDDRKLLWETLVDMIKQRPWWSDSVWDMDTGAGFISLWKREWYNRDDEGIYLLLQDSLREPVFSFYVFADPSNVAPSVGSKFVKLLEKEYSGKVPAGFSITFAKGVARLVKKDIALPLTGKDHPLELLNNLEEMIRAFENIIDKSVTELRKK